MATALLSAVVHCMLFGGSRSGKSLIICYAIIVRACKVKSRHLMVRLRFNHIKTSIWMDTLPKVISLCFPELMPSWQARNRSDYVWALPNGSEIWISGLDNADRVEKILGKEYSTIFFNECSQIDYSSIQIALTRLAEKNALKNRAYYDENPPSKSHWSYWQFIKKINPVDSEPLKNPKDYDCMLMNPVDNIENIDESYLEILQSMPEKDRERFEMGQFSDDSDGQAYSSFRREIHVGQTQKIQGTTIIGMDFNVSPMTALITQIIDGVLHVQQEVWIEVGDTYKMCSELHGLGHSGGVVIPDSTGANRKTSGKSDFIILKEAGFTIESTRNPLQRDRVNNTNRLFVANKTIINPMCKKLIGDMEKVVWKNGNLFEGSDKKLTHISDCLGYIQWKMFPINAMSNYNISNQRR
ncbi:MAG: hypothetical protein CO099_02655 [Bdellovibrio sp. CG_4_9_14_3_um_filter_39_7]|nr:MAG: hypothetical protein CO099_02655 [Bdellovibrio sp. CG_4_9_14_3_um_filter_39_7]